MSAGSTRIGPLRFHHGDRRFGKAIRFDVVAEQTLANDSDARATQAVRVESRRVVGHALLRGRDLVGRIGPRQRTEQRRRRPRPSAPWAGGVLAVGDRHDARAAEKADCRLDADERIGLCRRHDRPVRLRADGRGRQIRRYGDRRPRARAGGIAIQRVRVPRLTAAGAPAARRVRRSEIGPLAQIRLPEDDGASVSEPRDDERIRGRPDSLERERSGRGHHPVRGRDVVLDHDWDAVKRASRSAALRVQRRAGRRWSGRRD